MDIIRRIAAAFRRMRATRSPVRPIVPAVPVPGNAPHIGHGRRFTYMFHTNHGIKVCTFIYNGYEFDSPGNQAITENHEFFSRDGLKIRRIIARSRPIPRRTKFRK
ncbi:MAG: hypothetical protein J7M24_00160 [Candidatus Latescibacteria bacterium]|nr:hypothetical protein [Candidatus Latescibacterota bacterium]